jgi:hypothetical protein
MTRVARAVAMEEGGTMPTMAPITYREFYDVPRIFLVRYRGSLLLFDGLFDDALDEYPDEYKVYVLPELSQQELSGSWTSLSEKAVRYMGTVPVGAVKFDSTLRREIDTGILERLTRAQT